MDLKSEQDLVKAAQVFNLEALETIYDRYSEPLYRYGMRLLGDDDLAKECVAETFARFLNALHGGKGPREHLQAYLYRIAHNWVTDVYRRQPPPPLELDERHPAGGEFSPEKQAQDRFESEWMRAALYRLPPEQRQVIVLKYVEGWENAEIARALQKAEGNVRVLQHRALAALRKMSEPGNEDGAYGNG
jgi:RNA polymerase sigma-70 factor (ECF subfamily)